MSNLTTVQEIYAAFGRGDIPAILSKLAEDVDWEKWDDNSAQKAGVPYMRYRKGVGEVTEFFQEVAKLQITKFEVLSLMEGGNQVAAEIEVKAALFKEQEIHLWTFNDEGQVSRFRHYLDTAKHIAAVEKTQNTAA